MEFDNIVLRMNLLGTDEKTGKLLCSTKVELDGGPGGLAMPAESANLWHLRIGHIKRKSMDVLWRMPGSGVDYNGDIQACDVCAVGKSKRQAHPKQATYDVQHGFHLVTVNLMGPIKLAALASYSYKSSSTNTPSGRRSFSSRRNRKNCMLSSCTARHLLFRTTRVWFVSGRTKVRILRVLSLDSTVTASVFR